MTIGRFLFAIIGTFILLGVVLHREDPPAATATVVTRMRPIDMVEFAELTPACGSISETLDAQAYLRSEPTLSRKRGIPGCDLLFDFLVLLINPSNLNENPHWVPYDAISYDVTPDTPVPAGKVAICVSNNIYPLQDPAYCSWVVVSPNKIRHYYGERR